jgi:circadian clock protein KaiC
MRGRAFQGGFHDYTIRQGGLVIFPRLVAAAHPEGGWADKRALSGVRQLDLLVGEGLDYGTTNLVIGPSGSGKSTLALQFMRAAMERGEKVLIVSFDETERVFQKRATGLGVEVGDYISRGLLQVKQVDPAELSPGEMAGLIRHHVEDGVSVVVLDSLTGYQHAMPEEQFMMLQMHELVTYLNQQGVLTFLILAQSGMVGQMQSPVDLTYLSDAVLLLRFFEAQGELRRALSVLKKRTGAHEATIRELVIDSDGVHVGEKLSAFHGILTGTPVYQGDGSLLGSGLEN